jgi:hypothetical protein
MARTFLLLSILWCCGLGAAAAQTVIAQDSLPIRIGRASSLQISGETIICPGSITALKVEGAYKSYRWNTGHQTPNITVFGPGTYTVTVTTEGGCELTGSVTVRYSSSPCL